MNARSSRSHTIFRLVIESSLSSEEKEKRKEQLKLFNDGRNSPDANEFKSVKETNEDDSDVSVSYLNLVDLAGSERQRNTKSSGTQLKEGANINKSLLALGAVIQKLSEANPDSISSGTPRRYNNHHNQQAKSSKHIPYRNSKLTRILKTSLGGSTFTHVILAATPSPDYIEETLSTLQFGAMCKLMKNKAKLNKTKDKNTMLNEYKLQILKLKDTLQKQSEQITSVGADEELAKAKEEAEKQKRETEDLKERLKQMELALQGKGGNKGQGNNIMVKSSLNYNGVRMANVDGPGSSPGKNTKMSGWDKLRRIMKDKQKGDSGLFDVQRDLYKDIKAAEEREKEKDAQIAELKDSMHDLEHEVENLRNEAEDSSDLIEELQQNIADNADKQEAENAERSQLEELLIAKDKKIRRQESLITTLKKQIVEHEVVEKQIVVREAELARKKMEQTQLNFLIKSRKKTIKNDFLNLKVANRDYQDAVAMIQFEIEMQADELQQQISNFKVEKEIFKKLTMKHDQDYKSKLVNCQIKEKAIQKELESAEKLKESTLQMERDMHHTLRLHEVLPTLQRRFRKAQNERLKEFESKLKKMEMDLEEERISIVQERVKIQEESSKYKANEARLLQWEKKLLGTEAKLERKENDLQKRMEKYKRYKKLHEDAKNKSALREREITIRESSVAEMEKVFSQREQEINYLKSEVQHQLEEALKLKEDRTIRDNDFRTRQEHLQLTQKAIEAQLESIEARKKQLEHQNIEFVESQKQFEVDKTMMQDKLDKAIIQEYHLKHKLLETTNLQRKLDDREQRLHQKEMIVMKLESRSRKFAEKEAKLKGATLALQQREDLFYDKHATLIHYMYKKKIADLENHLERALETTNIYKHRAMLAKKKKVQSDKDFANNLFESLVMEKGGYDDDDVNNNNNNNGIRSVNYDNDQDTKSYEDNDKDDDGDDEIEWLESGSSYGSIDEEHDFLGESTYSDNNNSNEVVHNDEVDNEDDVKSIASSKSSIVVNVAL